MKIENTHAFEAGTSFVCENSEPLFNQISWDNVADSNRNVTLDNGLTRNIKLDAAGAVTSVTDSDGKERRLGLDGNWELYVKGRKVDTGYDIVDLKVSPDGKTITMGVIGQHRGVIMETEQGTIAAKEGGAVVGTNDEVMVHKQQALDALKRFLTSPASNKDRGIKI